MPIGEWWYKFINCPYVNAARVWPVGIAERVNGSDFTSIDDVDGASGWIRILGGEPLVCPGNLTSTDKDGADGIIRLDLYCIRDKKDRLAKHGIDLQEEPTIFADEIITNTADKVQAAADEQTLLDTLAGM